MDGRTRVPPVNARMKKGERRSKSTFASRAKRSLQSLQPEDARMRGPYARGIMPQVREESQGFELSGRSDRAKKR